MKKSNKIFLLICLGLAFAVDFSVMVFLLVGGVQGQFWLFPLFFALFDAAFILQAVFSNFRFKYTVAEIISYLVLSVVALLIMLWADVFPGGETYFTDGAAALWFILHFAGLITSLICYLRAANFLRGKAGAAVAALFIAVCGAGAGYYGVSLAANGFLGQGPETEVRPISYEYLEESDSYAVKRVLNGKGTSVTVPDEFNGKKVTRISSSIFYNAGITDVTLDCAPTVEITDNFVAAEGVTIHTPRANADAFRKNFFGGEYYSLANAVAPYDLEKDEVFVTFAYDAEAYQTAGDKFLPTYIAKKGTKFDLGYFKDIPYALRADRRSDEDLFWCLSSNGGKMLSPLVLGNGDGLNGATLNENAPKIKVGFERVYKVYPVTDEISSTYVNNDKKYFLADEFEYSVVNGATLDYKLTVPQFADEITSRITREGFNLEWWYANGNRTSQFLRCESLSALLERGLTTDGVSSSPDFVTLAPHWEMVVPEVIMTTDCEDNAVVYGENISFSVDAVSPVDGAVMTYYWERKDSFGQFLTIDNKTNGYSKYNFLESEAGTYYCTVTVTADCTSLSSNRTGSVEVKLNPRPLTVEWTYPQNDVYDGNYKQITCEIVDGVINNDNVSLFYNETNRVKYAGRHYVSVGLAVGGTGRYTIANESSASFEIKKAPLYIAFSEVETVYNGYDQAPEYIVNGEVETDVGGVQFSPVSAKNSAGVYDYALVIGTDTISSCYYIEGCTSPVECSFTDNRVVTKFTIKPYGVDVNWNVVGVNTGTSDRFTYDGKSHTVTATAKGVSGTNIMVDVTVPVVRDAGNYEITASCRSSNYTVKSGGEKTVIIDKKAVTPAYGSLKLTYNGGIQTPEAYIYGVGTDPSTIPVNGTGGAKNAGTYTFTATAPANANYELTGASSRQFTIAPYTVRINWSDNHVIYDGKPHLPKASAQGLGGDGELSFKVEFVQGGSPVNSGNYTCRGTIIDGDKYLAANYVIDGNYGDLSQLVIDRATLNVNPDDLVISAGETAASVQQRLTYFVTGFVNGEKRGDFNFGSVYIEIVDARGVVISNNVALTAGTYTLRACTSYGSHDQPLSGSNYVLHFGTGTLTVRE